MKALEAAIKTGYMLLGLRRGPDSAPVFAAQRVRKILAVRNDNLGDVLLTVPALRALRESFPRAELAVLVNAYTRPALEGLPWLDRIYSYDKFKHGRHPTRFHAWWQQYGLFKQLQQEGFDLAVGIRSNFSSSLAHLVYASAARWRLGHPPGERKKDLAFFYNLAVPRQKPDRHEVERSLDVVRAVGADTSNKELEFFIPPASSRQIDEWLERRSFPLPLLGIFFCQRPEEGRYWKIANYVALINGVLQRGVFSPLLIHARADEPFVERIKQGLEDTPPCFQTPDLKLLAALLRRCRAVVSLDGGPMHLAAAVGTRVIAVFAKADPLIWAPRGDGHIVLKKGACANEISAGEVLSALDQLKRN